MADSRQIKHAAVYAALGVGVVGFGTWGLLNDTVGYPWQLWFTDMIDAQYVRAYERPMAELPEGVVSRNKFVKNYAFNTAEAATLKQPHAVDEAFLAQGQWNFATYCAPCHGADAKGNAPVMDNSDGKKRFMFGQVPLVGQGGRLRTWPDSHVYLTIRNGSMSTLMPSYDWAMSDDEIWSVVAYLRSLPESNYIPPAPPQGSSEEG
ncbi:MAG: c-type cytochrome [Alphaproteobacteria bacterium]|nr:c-type cytochrome [Alphaproteobacteria bacterium]MCB9791583.1 c-type cytochrome [Alphaproteobacteria bacterium]